MELFAKEGVVHNAGDGEHRDGVDGKPAGNAAATKEINGADDIRPDGKERELRYECFAGSVKGGEICEGFRCGLNRSQNNRDEAEEAQQTCDNFHCQNYTRGSILGKCT